MKSRDMLIRCLEPTDELEHMLTNFETHLKDTGGKKATQTDLRNKEDVGLEELRKRERALTSAQGGLIANRDVS